MNSTVTLTTSPALSIGQLNCTLVNVASGESGIGRFMVPNKDVGEFLALAHYLTNIAFDDEGNLDRERTEKASVCLAERADELCAASNIVY